MLNGIKYSAFILITSLFFIGCKKEEPLYFNYVRDVVKLATSEVKISKVMAITKKKKIVFVDLSDVYFLAKINAVIKIGIDLDKISNSDIIEKNDTVWVKLPEIEVLNFNIPLDQIEYLKWLSNENSFLNKLTIADIDEGLRQAQDDIQKVFNISGQMVRYKNDVKNNIEMLFSTLGYKFVIVEFNEIP